MDKTNNTKQRIIIVEDSLIHSEWIKAELLDNDYDVLGVYQFGKHALLSIKSQNPSLVVLDFQLKDVTGLEVAKKIKLFDDSIKIFMLTAHTEISIVNRLVNDKNVDAIGIKSSPYFEQNFVTAISYVLNGGTYLDPTLLGKLRETNSDESLTSLTQREFEIFIQLNIGKNENKIANDLNIELATVRNLKSKITKKINRNNITSLVSKLVENAEA